MNAAHAYVNAVIQRGRDGMQPPGFDPDWSDAPRDGKFYPGAETIPLPAGELTASATLQDGLADGGGAGGFTLDTLGGMLLDSYGRIGRRLAVHANYDVPTLPGYPQARWARGTASGGARYPVSVYWAAGPGGPLLPGVYHYSSPHHAMQRLLAGDVTGEVREAVGDPALTDHTDQYLVLGIKFWQNSFKYGNFSYHVVSMDIGTIVQTWRMWARAHGLDVEPVLWFDEHRLTRLLGLPDGEEGVFAVIPLRWRSERKGKHPAFASAAPRVRLADSELSKHTRGFEMGDEVHAATLENAAVRPPAGAAKAAAPEVRGQGPAIPLPPPRSLGLPVREALRRRTSSFGRFTPDHALTPEELATALAGARAGALAADVGAQGLTKSYVFVNNVEAIAPGSYEFDPEQNALLPVKTGPQGRFLQEHYFLDNYNLELAGAVIVPAARALTAVDALGARGMRLVNAEIGAVSQAVYTACAGLGIGCGAALGFDNRAYIQELGLRSTDEAPLVILLIGHERPDTADFRYEIA
ncbi:SagB family peptide dehydrogenase [Streptomyces sp. NPDC001250]|uniref:SagB family peptide dehydrogenase n=1 Tax=unclassified Streptomyces TaxID=2593676 RepID=UPI00332E605E